MWKAFVVIACGWMSAGCLKSEVRILVRPDGSGTMKSATTLSPSQMAEMAKLVSPETAEKLRPSLELLFQTDPQAIAWSAGPDVRLLAAKPLKGVDSVGREVELEFDDVTKLRLELMPTYPGGLGTFYGIASTEPGLRPELKFNLATSGAGNPVLTVQLPNFPMDPLAEPPGAAATGTPAEMAQLRKALKGTRMSIAVETSTPLLRTNSPHHEDNEVVLVDIDVEAALFSRQVDMLRATPASFDEYLSMLSDLPGIRLAHDHAITIEFQGIPTPPSTDIFLAPLLRKGGQLALGSPENITHTPGYDNQPSFTPDGRSILFTSNRGDPDASGSTRPTDIYRYDLESRQTMRVTRSPESEYSPAVTPDGKRISVVRVEADGTQRLWSFAPDGTNPALLLPDIKPVGYYAWIDEHTVALYVLGQNSHPATLQVADTTTGRATIEAEDIGRSIQRLSSNEIAYVQHPPRAAGAGQGLAIIQVTLKRSGAGTELGRSALIPPVAGVAEPYPVWLPDGSVVMADRTTLYARRSGDADWKPIADLSSLGLTGVTRLAVNPAGDRIALVASGR